LLLVLAQNCQDEREAEGEGERGAFLHHNISGKSLGKGAEWRAGFLEPDVRCFAAQATNYQQTGGKIMPEQAQKGDTVRVHYTGRLADGQVFDSSEGGEPLEFTLGTGQVIKGFEDGVEGMAIGEEKQVEIESDNAYGERIEGLVQTVAREGLNLGEEPRVGMNLVMQLQDEQQIPVAVTEVTDDSITLDANHPLAGEKLIFAIKRVE
jgi:peptidylprolyl isomerase